MTQPESLVFIRRLRFRSAALVMVYSGALGLASAQTAQTAQTQTSLSAPPESSSAPALALAMRNAAMALAAATPAADQPRLLFAFDDTLRAEWHYTPRTRAGIALKNMNPAQRAQAVLSAQTYGDIVSRNVSQASPLDKGGLAHAAMNADQQLALLALLGQFAAHVNPALAAARMQRVRTWALDALTFAWVGSAQKGQGHYFRIQGDKFLIEYDNSGGNHVHSVWRDFDGDWGRDVLAEHYRRGRQATAAKL